MLMSVVSPYARCVRWLSKATSEKRPAEDNQPLHEVCELDPVPVTSRDHDRIYLRLLCWPGDADADGGNFYIVLDAKR